MKKFSLREVSPSGFFTRATYLDSQFVLTAPEMPFTKKFARILGEWGFTELYSAGEPCAHYSPDNQEDGKPGMIIGDPSTIRDLDKIKQAEVFYISFRKYVKTLFALVLTKNELDFNAVAEEIKSVCTFVRDNCRFLLRTQWLINDPRDSEQLVTHTVRSTIIAIIIGTSLKLQNYRLIELGVTALLHEIGMIKLPQESYQKKQTLTEQERKLLYAHPSLGYNILKLFNFPLVICQGVLEHHERENGTGYPQRKTSGNISMYAKIIAVACSFEAILSSRPHKEAKDGHLGILELMRNEGKQYDDSIVRALVYSLSIYPIGLYVMLSDGKKAQVIDANPGNPRFPIVQIFGETMPNGKNRTLQTSADSSYIIHPLAPEEIAELNR